MINQAVMEEDESIYDHIKQVFGDVPEQCNVLEEQIDVELQSAYFKFGKKAKKELDKEKLIAQMDDLFNEEIDLESKKLLLSRLAAIDEVSCFRAIERYRNNPDPELRDWSVLALQESRMLIQSRLLDEEQVYISTGMGGKGCKLRYFMVLISSDGKPLDEKQLKLVQDEFTFRLKKEEVEIEELTLLGEFITLVLMIPIKTMIKETFKQAIVECNQLGNFLLENFLITNVKRLSYEEVKEVLSEAKDK